MVLDLFSALIKCEDEQRIVQRITHISLRILSIQHAEKKQREER